VSRPQFEFERLEAFSLALESVVAVNEVAIGLPTGLHYLRDQLSRAATSVASNIAEGAGEYALAEKARFYRIAKRSATECAAQLLIGRRLRLSSDEKVGIALSLLHRVVSMVTRMIQAAHDRQHAPSVG
jgi:four helix bundle protein